MSDETLPSIEHHAHLKPAAWHVQCPVCECHIDVEKVLEDDAGIFHGEDECQIVECEVCQVLIEVLPATVGNAEGPPYRSRRR
jgi:hypothetical protein